MKTGSRGGRRAGDGLLLIVNLHQRRRVALAVMLGTLLNPLNSSMIAVALIRLHLDFAVSIATASWLISSFYLASAVAQPLLGRLADQFGARRVFLGGLLVVLVTGAIAPLMPGFGWLIGLRVVQAFGTSSAFPAGLAMIRSVSPGGRAPAGSLGALSVAASVSAALGPTLAGFLVGFVGWQAIFLVNVPLASVGLLLGQRWLPGGGSPAPAAGDVLRRLDLPGIVLFAATLTGLLAILLTASETAPIALTLLALPALAAVLLLWWERRTPEPFLDVRMLAANPRLLSIYAQFAGINLVFYSIFFALPIWLQQVRGLQPYQAGLFLLPISGLGVLVTPLAARLVGRSGPRPALVIGALALVAGSLVLLAFSPETAVWQLVTAGFVFGVPNGFNNLGLQAALYEVAPANATGAAGGQFQTFRYVGAVMSTSLLGLVFGSSISSDRLHLLAVVLVAASGVLTVAATRTRSRSALRTATPG